LEEEMEVRIQSMYVILNSNQTINPNPMTPFDEYKLVFGWFCHINFVFFSKFLWSLLLNV